MKRTCFSLLAFLTVGLFFNAATEQACAQPLKKDALHKIDIHLAHVTEAKLEHYMALPGVKVKNEAEFNKMKAHLLSLYKNVQVTHTFVGHGGNHIDCIPIEQQHGAVAEVKRGHKIQHTAPDHHAMPKHGDAKKHPAVEGVPLQMKKGLKDKFGKEMVCPEGSIPMRRVTLDQMTKFHTLNDFFQKHHGGSKRPPPTDAKVLKPEAGGTTHRYAHAYEYAKNYGGSSWLNLWDPAPATHQFALSQQWYVGGSPIQTLEGGWQVYPDFYGHSKPVLFIYWTADGYNNTGAYNLTKPGFIQVNNSFILGGAWSAYSSTNGTQFGFRMTWYRDSTHGNWWLYLTGAGSQTAIGYYPKSLYGNGQMSKWATEIDYGGEVTGQPTSGQMGSGAFAKTGWQHAAFQKDIYYFPTETSSAWANLTGSITNPALYTIDLHNNTGSNWGSYFYFGGPGGK